VNGGTHLTPSEKDELDEWYVRHASLLLDLRIIMMTLRVAGLTAPLQMLAARETSAGVRRRFASSSAFAEHAV
jgi:hypothetical protein